MIRHINAIIHDIMDKKGVGILMAVFAVLFILETMSQLRIRKQNRLKRTFINTIFSFQGFIALRLLLLPAMVGIAYMNQQWKFGLNYLYTLPDWMEGAIAFVILDFTNYLWHILNHKSALLWRFHLVHHTDIDLDVSTAIRFHAGELFFSIFFRGFFVLVTGATPVLVIIYEICFEAATLFHHSNWKIPFPIERVVNMIFVTPRMHGIHHSIIRSETDSNFSVIFSFWDRLTGTANLNISQKDIVTGVPVYGDPKELTVGYLLKLPFTKIWKWEKHQPTRGRNKKNKLNE